MERTAILIENKKAKIRYAVVESFSAGLELSGSEVKSLRGKHGSLDGSRVVVRGGEAYLVGATIPQYASSAQDDTYEAERPRRLLLKKSEVQELADAESKKGLTVVPLEMYNNRYIKVRIAVVRGKGKADRREDLKRKDANREMERILKRRV